MSFGSLNSMFFLPVNLGFVFSSSLWWVFGLFSLTRMVLGVIKHQNRFLWKLRQDLILLPILKILTVYPWMVISAVLFSFKTFPTVANKTIFWRELIYNYSLAFPEAILTPPYFEFSYWKKVNLDPRPNFIVFSFFSVLLPFSIFEPDYDFFSLAELCY